MLYFASLQVFNAVIVLIFSKNIKEALVVAKRLKVSSVGFYGKTGGLAKKYTDNSILVPSKNTARIQECHIFLGHYILEKTEDILIKN